MGQHCSQDHEGEPTEVNEIILTVETQLEREKEAFETFQKYHLHLESKLRKEIHTLENEKVALTRELSVKDKSCADKDKDIAGHIEEIEILQNLISETETELAEVKERRDQLRLELLKADAELNGSKYRTQREKIAKMESEVKKKKQELKGREKSVSKREKEAKKILEQQQILEKRLEDCNRREIAVEKVEGAQQAQIAKHMLNVQQTSEMKQILTKMNQTLAQRKKELKQVEQAIRIKEDRANNVLEKESDILKKHEEISKFHKEKEKGVMELRAQLTSSMEHKQALRDRQSVVEATARITEKETETIARQQKMLGLQQSDLERMEAELEKTKKALEAKDADLARREEALDDDEAEIEIKRMALKKLENDTRNAPSRTNVKYYKSKTSTLLDASTTRGEFKVKGDRDRPSIQASDPTNFYAQAYSVQKASEKLSGLGKKDPTTPSNGVAGSLPPELPPRPSDAPRERSKRRTKSSLIAPPNLPKPTS